MCSSNGSTGWYWHHVLRNQSAQNRKALWKLTTLTFRGAIERLACILCAAEVQKTNKSFAITIQLHTMSWALRSINRSQASVEEVIEIITWSHTVRLHRQWCHCPLPSDDSIMHTEGKLYWKSISSCNPVLQESCLYATYMLSQSNWKHKDSFGGFQFCVIFCFQ